MSDHRSAAFRIPRPPQRARFLLVAVIVPLLLAGFAVWLVHEYGRAATLRAEARASYTQRLMLGDLLGDLLQAEASQRGFLLTGDPTFLTSYDPASSSVRTRLRSLAEAFGDDPEQARLLARAGRLADTKFADMAAAIEVRRRGGLIAGAASVEYMHGKRPMQRLRLLIGRMQRIEAATTNRRIAQFDERTRMTRSFVWIGAVIGSLLLLLAMWLLWRQRCDRYRADLQAFEAAERNRAVLDSTTDAVAIIDRHGTIQSMNAAAGRLLGYAQDELVGRATASVIEPVDGTQTFAQRIGLHHGRIDHPFLANRSALHRDGHRIPVDIALGIMRLPDGDHVVASVRDMTERRRAEQLKDELMATVSHELRTPLTSVVGALGLLRSGAMSDLPAPAVRLVEIAENNSRRLIRLINDMLDIDRLQSGQLAIGREPLDLRDVVTQASEGSEGLARANGVRIACVLPAKAVPVNGDADRLLQVVTNLASNAIRVSPPAGTVTIGVQVERGGRAIVSVDDEGAGVPTEFRHRIFGRFERARGEQSPGTGLGLAISREIVQRHDGRIWFEDRRGGGTRFAFAIALRTGGGPFEHHGEPAPVLVVTEDHELAGLVDEAAAAIGQSVEVVATAAAVHEQLAERPFAALVIDLDRPDAGALARSLQTGDQGALPSIVIAAHDRAADDPPAPIAPVDRLTRPIDPERLQQAMRQALSRSDASRPTILHVDRDADMLDVTASLFAPEARVLKARDLATARNLLASQRPDVAIFELDLGEENGLDLLPMLIDDKGVAIPAIIYSTHEVAASTAARVDAVMVKSRRSLPDLRATVRSIMHPHEVAQP